MIEYDRSTIYSGDNKSILLVETKRLTIPNDSNRDAAMQAFFTPDPPAEDPPADPATDGQ